jgi:hypothetical protein
MELETSHAPHVDPIGRWVVRIIDRTSGNTVVENRWGHDRETAELDLQPTSSAWRCGRHKPAGGSGDAVLRIGDGAQSAAVGWPDHGAGSAYIAK